MSSQFGSVLKEWRSTRRMSQMDLGLAAEVSTRHISFLESGRSNPSRPMVLHLANALEVPRTDRNRLLTAAGFAPLYGQRNLDDPAMDQIRYALRWTLERHDPFPGIALDRHWNVVDQNESSAGLFALLGITPPVSMLEVLLDPEGLQSLIENWHEVGPFLLTRLRTESTALGGDAILEAAIQRLRAGVEGPGLPGATEAFPPVLTTRLRLGDTTISLMSTIAHFGSAEDIALADIRIELFFPADDTTLAFFKCTEPDVHP